VGGDVVTLATTDNPRATEEIQKLFGLNAAKDDGHLRIEVNEGAAFIPRLVRELSMPVSSVAVRRPSLDDVFLKLTGHAIRDEEADRREQMRAMAARWGRRR
jgi:ABC-2 type transport system ATP-binding protein